VSISSPDYTQEPTPSQRANTSEKCQVLTSGRLPIEKDRDVEFSGRGQKRIADAHGGEFIGVATRGPRPACPCKPRDAARSEVRKAEGRADEIPIFARGLGGFAPLAERSRYAIGESHTAVVKRSVALDEATAAHRAQPRAQRLCCVASIRRDANAMPDRRFAHGRAHEERLTAAEDRLIFLLELRVSGKRAALQTIADELHRRSERTVRAGGRGYRATLAMRRRVYVWQRSVALV